MSDVADFKLESQSPFVGRQFHINHVHRWINTSSAHSEIVHIIGMGGIGKSALLRQFVNIAREHKVRTVWVDGASCSGSVDRFLEMIEAQLPSVSNRKIESSSRVQNLLGTLAADRTLLCIDDFDHLQSMHGWFQTVLIAELNSTGLLVALASRRPCLSTQHQGVVGSRGITTFMNLEPLTRDEVRNYFERLNLIQPADYELINGHPVAMKEAARRLINDVSSNYLAWPVSHTVSVNLLREFVAPELHEALDVLSILPDTSYEELNGFLTSPLNKQHWHQLTQLSFVRPVMNGVGLDPVARTHLLNDFKHREPKRYLGLRDQIVDNLNQRCNAQCSTGSAITMMIVNRDLLTASPICVVPADPGVVQFEQVAPSDLMHLHQIIEDERSQQTTTLRSQDDAHRLLDDMAQYFPENIRVMRGRNGIPAVFHAGIPLNRDTCDWVETHHPKVLTACFGEDYNRMSQLDTDDADTYFHLLGGASRNNEEHSFQELYGQMMLDGFSHIAVNGMRLTLTTSSDLSKDYFTPLVSAIRSLPGLPLSHPASTDIVMEFDWRTTHLGGWLRTVMNRHMVRATDRAVRHVTEAQVMECLSFLNHRHILERTALGKQLGGTYLYHKLQSFLNESPPPPPIETWHQNILRLLSQNPRLRPESAAQTLSMSRSSYYRHRQAALTAVALLLSTS